MTERTDPTERPGGRLGGALAPLLWGLAAFSFATAIGVVAVRSGIPLAAIARDPASQFDYPAYGGLLSHLGVMILVATAAICAFAARLVRAQTAVRILWTVAALSVVLALDDLLLLHERLDDTGQGIVFALYGLAVAGMAWTILRSGLWHGATGLLVVLGFLGLSAVVDLTPWSGPAKLAVEDFSKFAGFAAWLAFWSRFARSAVDPRT